MQSIRVVYYQGRPQGLNIFLPVSEDLKLPKGYAYKDLIPVRIVPNSPHADGASHPILTSHIATGNLLRIDIVEGLGKQYYKTLQQLMGDMADQLISHNLKKGCFMFVTKSPWDIESIKNAQLERTLLKIHDDQKS